jgi:hypothetical protein
MVRVGGGGAVVDEEPALVGRHTLHVTAELLAAFGLDRFEAVALAAYLHFDGVTAVVIDHADVHPPTPCRHLAVHLAAAVDQPV